MCYGVLTTKYWEEVGWWRGARFLTVPCPFATNFVYMIDFDEVDISKATDIMLFPIGTRLIKEWGIWRYAFDNGQYKWIPEYEWENGHPSMLVWAKK